MPKNKDIAKLEKSNLLLDMEIAYEHPEPSPDETAAGEMPTLKQMRAWLARDPKGFLKDLVKLQAQYASQVQELTEQREARLNAKRAKRAEAEDAEAREPEPGYPPPERVEDLARALLEDCLKAANL